MSVIVQCGYAFYFFSRIFLLPRKKTEIVDPLPVSIIICARNEADNLKQNLPFILSQRYRNDNGKPLFEVIVVNDASTDNTSLVLEDFKREYDNLRCLTISEQEYRDLKGKKFALKRGVAQASYDYLLLTDADCKPASDEWLAGMVAPLFMGKEIVAGYGGFYKTSGLLNAFIRWETLHTFLQYSTYALAGKPYMAVGRNLACTRHVFERAQDSKTWNNIPSGDDDLLVNKMANHNNMAIVCHKNAFTYSTAKKTWKEYIAQKQRHLSTSKFYKKDIMWLLSIYGVYHAIIWLYFIACLAFYDWHIITAIMLVRCLLYWATWAVASKKLGEKLLISYFPLFDIGWMIYNFGFSPYVFWKNKKQWK